MSGQTAASLVTCAAVCCALNARKEGRARVIERDERNCCADHCCQCCLCVQSLEWCLQFGRSPLFWGVVIWDSVLKYSVHLSCLVSCLPPFPSLSFSLPFVWSRFPPAVLWTTMNPRSPFPFLLSFPLLLLVSPQTSSQSLFLNDGVGIVSPPSSAEQMPG